MKITVTITDETARNILISAVEGGSNYWARFESANYDNVKAKLVEHDPGQGAPGPYTVTASKIAKGIERALSSPNVNIRKVGATAVSDICDAGDADVILQLAVLGEVVYG